MLGEQTDTRTDSQPGPRLSQITQGCCCCCSHPSTNNTSSLLIINLFLLSQTFIVNGRYVYGKWRSIYSEYIPQICCMLTNWDFASHFYLFCVLLCVSVCVFVVWEVESPGGPLPYCSNDVTITPFTHPYSSRHSACSRVSLTFPLPVPFVLTYFTSLTQSWRSF